MALRDYFKNWSEWWNGAGPLGFGAFVVGKMISTRSGEVISPEGARTLSAVYCATMVISEGLASLPLNMRLHVDNQRTETAYGKKLWELLHDEPCEGMDSFAWFDMQVKNQIYYGEAFAEILRNESTGEVESLIPIHPERVTNWQRGPYVDVYGDQVGKADEIVWFVRGDNGRPVAIPERDMLHVPVDIGRDGVRGTSRIEVAAESLGIIQATDAHVGSFFRNGASPDFAVITKAKPPPEEQERLRTSFQNKQGGTRNAHKAMLLFGDTDVKTIGVKPSDAQLLESRKFGVEEVSRFWKVPKHFLSSMDQATYNNVELMNLGFLTYTLTPWLIRWEKALKRQLLSKPERLRYSFKFNQNALMRGDAKQRSEYYSKMFDMGVFCIDDILELEDMNPLPDGLGQRRFITGNNRVPLDRVDDMGLLSGSAEAKEEPKKDEEADKDESASATAGLRQATETIVTHTLGGMISLEAREMRRAANVPREFEERCKTFYAEKFQPLLISQLGPILEASIPFGVTTTIGDFADAHVTASRTALMACLDQPMQQFSQSVNAVIDQWDLRAATETKELFSGAGEDHAG